MIFDGRFLRPPTGDLRERSVREEKPAVSLAVDSAIDAEARAVSRRVLDGEIGQDEGLRAILELAERSNVHSQEGAIVARKHRSDQARHDAAEAYRDIFVDRILNPERGWDFRKSADSSLCGALRQLARNSTWVSHSGGRPRTHLREVLTGDDTEVFAPHSTDPATGDDESRSAIESALGVGGHLRPFAAIRAICDRESIPTPIRPKNLRDRTWLAGHLDGRNDIAVRSLQAFHDLITGDASPDLDVIDDRLLSIWDSMTVDEAEALLDLDERAVALVSSYAWRDFICPSKTDLRRMRSILYDAGPRTNEWQATAREVLDAFLAVDTDGTNPRDRRGHSEPKPPHKRNTGLLRKALETASDHPGRPLGAEASEVYETLCRTWSDVALRMMEDEHKSGI